MECSELTERMIDRLTGRPSGSDERELEAHLASCAVCRAEAPRLEAAWRGLGADRDLVMTEGFRARSLALLEDEMARQRIRAFRPRRDWKRPALQAAAVLLAATIGWFAHRSPAAAPAKAVPAGSGALAANESVSNVSYRPADETGRVAVSFDVSARRTVVGRPEDPAVANLLAYLVSRDAQTSGEKARAIELVSSQYGAGAKAAVSPEIVRALTTTLAKDENPGVRKKAAAALASFPITPEIRTALLDALAHDRNPAVRLTAIEALAAAARQAPADERTIESLRQKAFDPAENGFVRAKAASALKAMEF